MTSRPLANFAGDGLRKNRVNVLSPGEAPEL
jgi:hypothetical protein